MRLSVDQLYELVRRHGAESFLDRIMVTAALTESEGNTDAAGDKGADGVAHSYGLWQLYDRGIGSGMSPSDRCDHDKACDRMLPEFRRTFQTQQSEGYTGELLALRTYLWTERPRDYQNLQGDAARRFNSKWPLTEPGGPAPPVRLSDFLAANPNIVEQRATWATLRRSQGLDPNDWEAFRQHLHAIFAPDPGDVVPVDFPIADRAYTMASLAGENPNIIEQRATWAALRQTQGRDPNDWEAFRQHLRDLHAPDPGPHVPIDFRPSRSARL